MLLLLKASIMILDVPFILLSQESIWFHKVCLAIKCSAETNLCINFWEELCIYFLW